MVIIKFRASATDTSNDCTCSDEDDDFSDSATTLLALTITFGILFLLCLGAMLLLWTHTNRKVGGSSNLNSNLL